VGQSEKKCQLLNTNHSKNVPNKPNNDHDSAVLVDCDEKNTTNGSNYLDFVELNSLLSCFSLLSVPLPQQKQSHMIPLAQNFIANVYDTACDQYPAQFYDKNFNKNNKNVNKNDKNIKSTQTIEQQIDPQGTAVSIPKQPSLLPYYPTITPITESFYCLNGALIYPPNHPIFNFSYQNSTQNKIFSEIFNENNRDKKIEEQIQKFPTHCFTTVSHTNIRAAFPQLPPLSNNVSRNEPIDVILQPHQMLTGFFSKHEKFKQIGELYHNHPSQKFDFTNSNPNLTPNNLNSHHNFSKPSQISPHSSNQPPSLKTPPTFVATVSSPCLLANDRSIISQGKLNTLTKPLFACIPAPQPQSILLPFTGIVTLLDGVVIAGTVLHCDEIILHASQHKIRQSTTIIKRRFKTPQR